MGFTGLDYFVLTAYLIATALVGMLVGRGNRNTRDYFLGGRHMPWWAISISIVATETSTLSFIGAPAIAYAGNLTFLQLVLGYFAGRVLVSLVLIPAYFRGEIQTAYELLQRRFGGKTRNLAAALFQVSRGLSDGVRLFATALVLSVVTQFSDVQTIVIIGAITIFYTFYGGMRSVVWNDVVQWIIYIAGALLVGYEVLSRLPGGWDAVVAVAGPAHKFQFLDFSFQLTTAYTFWAGILGGAFLTFATHGTDQMMVQRYLSCGSRRGSQWALITSGGVVFLQFLLFLLIGVLLFAFYRHFPPAQVLTQADRILPLFIVQELSPGISGLIVAAIFAAAMSTLSSSLNALASSSVNDFYRNYVALQASEQHYLRVSRLLTLLWGLALIAVALAARGFEQSVLESALTITSVPMGSLLGIFLLGLWSPAIRQSSGLTGMVSGILAVLILVLLAWAGRPLLAWTWYVLVGTSITFLAGLLHARLFGASDSS